MCIGVKNYNDVRTGDVIEVFESSKSNVPSLKVVWVVGWIRLYAVSGSRCLMRRSRVLSGLPALPPEINF